MLVYGVTPFTYIEAVTPHDTNDNIKNGIALHNAGTSGAVTIRQGAGYGNVSIWLNQGETHLIGRWWEGAMSTGLGAGMTLRVLR